MRLLLIEDDVLLGSSTKLGLERIKRAQAEGQRVWVETCPQYLLLTDREMERLGPFAKIGPPLRPADGPDRDALWAGLAGGSINTIASDHAPRPPQFKEPGRTNIFVDPQGKLVYAGGIDSIPSSSASDIPKAVNYVKQGLSEALAGKPISAATTRPYGCSIKYKSAA